MNKYKLLINDFITVNDVKLHRVIALKDFANVKKGEKGGYIRSEKNLSQEGNAWIFDNAWIYGDAWIYDNARISDNAQISGNACIYGDAWIFDNAWIYGNACIYDNARISDNAQISGNACIYGDAWIYGNACIYGDAWIYGNAWIMMGYITQYNTINDQIKAQLGIAIISGKIILYKRVNKISNGKYSACYDNNFIYEDGKVAKVKDCNMDKTISCGTGIHLSIPNYWNEGDTLIACEVKEEDIITCLEGKVRVKKCKVIGEVK